MPHTYPPDLPHEITAALRQSRYGVEVPLPTNDSLLAIVESAYQASLATEEGRQLALHVCYAPPDFFENSNNAVDLRPMRFQFRHPLPLTTQNLVKLSPALNPWKTALLTAESRELGLSDCDDPMIWGLLELRSDWSRRSAGESAHPYVPPHVLSICSTKPGELVVGAAGLAYLALRRGRLERGGEGLFRLYDVRQAFSVFTSQIARSTAASFGVPEIPHAPGDIMFGEWSLLQLITRIRFLSQHHGHGACFLFVDRDSISQAVEAGHLAPKYDLEVPSLLWPLVGEATSELRRLANSGYGPLRHFKGMEPKLSAEVVTNELLGAAKRGESIDAVLADVSATLARFSQVDGAVLIDDHFACRGFGVEIRVPSDGEIAVSRALTPEAERRATSAPANFGTRHRSAFRLCFHYPGAVALVISQDGPTKLCKRVGDQVVFWDVTAPGLFYEWAQRDEA
ncbi:MAG: putative sensor domain DACNV-containing protein [Halobacteriota archaeon]